MRFNYNRSYVINEKITENQKVCSLHSNKSPYYYVNKAHFAKLEGYCAGNCRKKFSVVFPEKIQKGTPTKANFTSTGGFSLVPDKPTGRQIRGETRKVMGKNLKSDSSNNVYLQNYAYVQGLRILHNNIAQQSQESLRT